MFQLDCEKTKETQSLCFDCVLISENQKPFILLLVPQIFIEQWLRGQLEQLAVVAVTMSSLVLNTSRNGDPTLSLCISSHCSNTLTAEKSFFFFSFHIVAWQSLRNTWNNSKILWCAGFHLLGRWNQRCRTILHQV